MKNLSKYLFIVLTAAGLSSCTAGKYGLMDRDEITEFAGDEPLDEFKYTGYKSFKSAKTLGAVSINRFNEETSENEKTLMKIKRHRSYFYAETNLFESTNKAKSFFDESVMNVGVDKKTKGLNLQFSFKF